MDPQTSPTKAPMSGLAVTALVIGIVALITSLIPIVNNISFFLGILAVIFGIIGIVQARKGSKSGLGLAVGGLVTAVLACILVLVSQAAYSAAIDKATQSMNETVEQINESVSRASGDATEDILANELDVVIGQFSAVDEGYGYFDTSLPVTVTNISDKPLSFSVQLEAVSASGERLDTTYVSGSNLGAGQTQNFEAFTYVSGDNVPRMQEAAFKIVQVSAY